jgi:predicted metal-binding protein
MTKHTLFVCKSCAYSSTQRDYLGQRGGYHLLGRLLRLQPQWTLAAEYAIAPVECLSACNRPCVVAYAAPHKTTLMFGDIPPLQSAMVSDRRSAIAILQLAEQYYVSLDGLVSRQERPDILKKGNFSENPSLPACQSMY